MSQSLPERGRESGSAGEPFYQTRRCESVGVESTAWSVLDEIEDPHLPISLVEMAMIYDVTINEGEAIIDMTFPCLGCPAYDMIQDDIHEGLQSLDAVENVRINMVWEPVWSKDLLTPEVRSKLQEFGVGI